LEKMWGTAFSAFSPPLHYFRGFRKTPPLFVLRQCQSQAWIRKEGDARDVCNHSVGNLQTYTLAFVSYRSAAHAKKMVPFTRTSIRLLCSVAHFCSWSHCLGLPLELGLIHGDRYDAFCSSPKSAHFSRRVVESDPRWQSFQGSLKFYEQMNE